MTTLTVVAAFTPMKDRLQAPVEKRYKEPSEATGRLQALGQQIKSRVTPVDPHQVTRRLLEEAALAIEQDKEDDI